MRSISIMYDSLNRHMLSPYGGQDLFTPNFMRLAAHTAIFDQFYCGSMPCMPARRELHTGRYNFLHRSWGPLEPFDCSGFQLLSENGICTHFVSDHAHYWQEGGLNYHNRFSSYEFIRGQEGDFTIGDALGYEKPLDIKRQDRINREHIHSEQEHPHVKTFLAGMQFLQENWDKDNWHLHLEYFDPHEPFFVPNRYKKMVDEQISTNDWPPYAPAEIDAQNQEYRRNYCALLLMCDTYLGKLLDFLDEHDMWKDTALLVNTDHGFLLGEHGYYAKNYMPTYQELCHIPFFLWDPVSGHKEKRVQALSQTIDIAPTLLELHGLAAPEVMQGCSLLRALREGKKVRDYALFGSYGKHVNITDGRYVYMRAGRNERLYEYTLMPTHIFSPFSNAELRDTERVMVDDFAFTQGIPVMRIPASTEKAPDNSCYWYDRHMAFGDLLFDTETDPHELHPLEDPNQQARLEKAMAEMLRQSDAPKEQYARLDLKEEDAY